MLVLGNKPTNGRLEAMLDKLNPILTEKVNAELEFTYIEWTDWQTQYNLKLLSGDSSLDLICTATDWLYGWENTKKGAFLPLSEDMLKTYAPKTWEQVSADGDWDICKYNDEIYFIPEDHYTQYTNHGMFYRGDWAKEAGLENGKITKFEDLTTYFQYIKDNKEVAGKAVKLENVTDKQGFHATMYIKFNPEKGRPYRYDTNPDNAQKVAPSNESRTQVAVNSEGKTNEATKNLKEPLRKGQTAPKDTAQQQQQEKPQKRNNKGMKM